MLLLRCLALPDEQALKDAIAGNEVAVDVTEQAIRFDKGKHTILICAKTVISTYQRNWK